MKLQKSKQRMIGNQYENFKQKLLNSEQTYQLSTKSFTPLQSQDKGNRTSSTPLEVSQIPRDDHPQFHEALRTVKSGIGFKQQMIQAVPFAINSGQKYMVFRPFNLFQLSDSSNDESQLAMPNDKGYYYKFNC